MFLYKSSINHFCQFEVNASLCHNQSNSGKKLKVKYNYIENCAEINRKYRSISGFDLHIFAVYTN